MGMVWCRAVERHGGGRRSAFPGAQLRNAMLACAEDVDEMPVE